MATSMSHPLVDLHQSWSRAVTSLVWGQWLMLDMGFQAMQRVLGTATSVAGAPATGGTSGNGGTSDLLSRAVARMKEGLPPPREIYLAPYRNQIDWTKYPDWARPSDPDLFESGHEG
jgi:hypothetical protein